MESRIERSRKWVNANTGAAVAVVVATALIPGSASLVLTAQEANMAYHIGKIYNKDFDWHDVSLAGSAIGLAGLAGQLVALEATILLGPLAFPAKGVIAAGIVKAMGEAIIAHLEIKYPN